MNPRATKPPPPFTVGDWHVRPLDGVLERGGESQHLRPKSMDVLVLLASRPRSTVSRDEFFRRVWNGQFVDDASLARCIAEIRAALGDDARNPRYVENVPRRGYRLIASVDECRGWEVLTFFTGRRSGSAVADPQARRRRLLTTLAYAAGIAAAGFLIGWWHAERGPSAGEGSVAPAEGASPVVAILGVRNLSGDAAYDWLQPALEQMLTTELAVSDLGRAVPAAVALHTAHELLITPDNLDEPEPLRRVASSLGARYLVTGSYLAGAEADAEALRIDLLVHDGTTGEVVEGVVETGSVGDLSTLVLSAGRRLRGLLGFGVGPANRAAQVSEGIPSDAEAARLYFRALLRLDRGEAEEARNLLQKAIEIDAVAPFAHLALAEAWASLGYDSRAAASAAKALELTASLPAEDRLWTEARAYSLGANWPAAVERLEALRLLAPNNLEYGLALADARSESGDFVAAVEIVNDLRLHTSFQGTEARLELIEARAAAGRGDFALSADAARRAAVAAQRVNAPVVQGSALELEARASYELGDVDAAQLAFTRAMEIFDAAGERRRAASARVVLAGWMQEQGKEEEAWRTAEAALEVFTATGDRRGEAVALREAAFGRWSQVSAEDGIAALRRSIELSREIGDRVDEARSLTALAVGHAFYGEGADVELFEEALAIYRAIGARQGVATSLLNIGKAALDGGDVHSAIDRLGEAETIYAELGTPDGRGTVLYNLGYAYFEAAEVTRSGQVLREAARVFEDLGNDRMLAASLDGLADALVASGELAEARQHRARCHELRATLGEPFRILWGELGDARLLLAEGHPRRALQVAQRAQGEASRLPETFGPQALLELAEDTVAEIQLVLGRPDLARSELERTEALDPEGELTLNLCNRWLVAARVLAALDDVTGARRFLDNLRDFATPRGLERLRLEGELVRAELGLPGTDSRPDLAGLEAELRRRRLVVLADRALKVATDGQPSIVARRAQ